MAKLMKSTCKHAAVFMSALALSNILAMQAVWSKDTAKRFSGNISYYGKRFHGKKTASGQKFDMNAMTCAHRTLPFGTKLLVEHPKSGKSVVVTVNDRGPFHAKRVLDLAMGAASKLGILLGGVAYVDVTVMGDNPQKSDKDADDKRSLSLDQTIGFVPEAMLDLEPEAPHPAIAQYRTYLSSLASGENNVQ